MRYLIVVIIILSSCLERNGNEKNNYVNSCIRFEHVGESDNFHSPTIISLDSTWCGLAIDSSLDTLQANVQITDSLTYNLVREYVLNHRVIYDSDYLQNEVVCSGYEVFLIEDDEVISNYFILERKDFHSYFGNLKEGLKKNKGSSYKLVTSLDEYFHVSDFYCRDR